jgi:hypothetical protein
MKLVVLSAWGYYLFWVLGPGTLALDYVIGKRAKSYYQYR